MTQTTNRDPADSSALIPAVLAWIADQSDEADIALEAVLMEQGVLSPADIVESFHVELGRAHGTRDLGITSVLITMALGDGSTWLVSTVTWGGEPYDVWVRQV